MHGRKIGEMTACDASKDRKGSAKREEEPVRMMHFTEQLMQEGNMVVAYCPELDVSSCGHTVAEARSNLQTALRLFIEEAARMGTLREILGEAGYDVDEIVMQSPTISVERQELVLAEPVAEYLA
jgi:predicted RNase H-like HicB family nuclease